MTYYSFTMATEPTESKAQTLGGIISETVPELLSFAVKSMFVLNGAAAVAVYAGAVQILTSDLEGGRIFSFQLMASASQFAGGSFLGFLSIFVIALLVRVRGAAQDGWKTLGRLVCTALIGLFLLLPPALFVVGMNSAINTTAKHLCKPPDCEFRWVGWPFK